VRRRRVYTAVWCRAALAAGVCDRTDDRYRLAPHMATLLLDHRSPAYVGGVFTVMEQPEMFDRFERVMPSGERMWWDDTRHAALVINNISMHECR